MILFGRFLGYNFITKKIIKLLFYYSDKRLKQRILGIEFSNPVGLAAGFDKDAQLTRILPSIGFGFAEIGSITGEPCKGNPKPRLWRLIKSKSIVVNYGLKNDGSKKIADRLKDETFEIPIGVSIAKTNDKSTISIESGINDYLKTCKRFLDIGDYFTINISCPNAFGGEPFTDAKKLDKLLNEIDKLSIKKPIFVKLSPDLTKKEVDDIINVSKKHKISGFICTNLTKIRNKKIIDSYIPERGGISGKVVEDLSNELISYVYKKTTGKFVIIGCGGVFSAEDAYKKIKSGASLIQLITGMIFEGPQVISEINLGVIKLLERDGFRNISDAVGADFRR